MKRYVKVRENEWIEQKYSPVSTLVSTLATAAASLIILAYMAIKFAHFF